MQIEIEIPRGNTQVGVNAAVIQELRSRNFNPLSLLDVPCGDGEFLKTVGKFFPESQVLGIDLHSEPQPEIKKFFIRASGANWPIAPEQKFRVITCISGVMCFDGLPTLFSSAEKHLEEGGLFIVTNDNIITVRDRLSFLFFGRLKRFAKLYSPEEGNWNVVPIQALWKLYITHGFEIQKIQYTSLRWEDFLFAPLAAIIYPLEIFYLMMQNSKLTMKERLSLFPFSALLARHYVMVGLKTTGSSRSKKA